MMKECPVGYLLREAPYIYDLMSYLIAGENISPVELGKMPRFYSQMYSTYKNELARISDLRRRQNEARRHASIATQAVSHGR